MRLYPAIDMKDGACVRLTKGKFDAVTVYAEHPYQVAEKWEREGASFLHLVDLDGALRGHSVNETAIRKIIERVSIPTEIGGGIRSREDVRRMLNLGIFRVILGTKAVERPEFLRELVEEFGAEHIVAGIDAKDGLVAIQGWETISQISALDLCLRMKEYGIRHIIYTDISRDGTLSGPNISYTKELTDRTQLDIIASGGVSGMADLDALCAAGIGGAILGKALYEKKLSLREAVEKFERA
ncbi:MAG: 1-(5-phosphoribosyl)-5-[(5-phosphoribosylamino)methylideneamino]imidazole-4-carboxamide isomerase [bacterium]|nr:1-(5-phosphoribosyl)-5-[(5-phosphoribosylamino)methylideneamino]imidazole-4-carboxamide isomerase [bacterium]